MIGMLSCPVLKMRAEARFTIEFIKAAFTKDERLQSRSV